ncbi:Putative signal transducing protein [Xenorhabdus japonica]|uniref:Putative signal transducing protein n=2 Tax=Xenorhabdus japonica TaxID=53341 RepID=A0A1I4YSW5_9GAMM|nr:Putative signal transducing protein [Xenorhabdus japonica]
MQLLANFLSPIDAHIVLGRMLSEDIYAVVIDEDIVWNNYMYSQAFGGVKLLVHQSDIERAKTILAEIKDNKFSLDKVEFNQDNKKKSSSQYHCSELINTFLILLLFLIFGIALPIKA